MPFPLLPTASATPAVGPTDKMNPHSILFNGLLVRGFEAPKMMPSLVWQGIATTKVVFLYSSHSFASSGCLYILL